MDGPFVHIWCERCNSNKSILSSTTGITFPFSVFFFSFDCRFAIIFPFFWIANYCIGVLLKESFWICGSILVVHTMYTKLKTTSQCLCVIDLSHTSRVFITSNFATSRMLFSGLLIGSAVWILYSRILMLQNCFMFGWGSVPVYMQLWFLTTPSDSLSRLRNQIFMPFWHWYESSYRSEK